jgi:hypothetical protein
MRWKDIVKFSGPLYNLYGRTASPNSSLISVLVASGIFPLKFSREGLFPLRTIFRRKNNLYNVIGWQIFGLAKLANFLSEKNSEIENVQLLTMIFSENLLSVKNFLDLEGSFPLKEIFDVQKISKYITTSYPEYARSQVRCCAWFRRNGMRFSFHWLPWAQ